MRVAFRPEALAEVLEARAWYEQKAPGLGLEFARAIEASVESAARTPEAYPLIEGECRRVLLRRFPYSILFRSSDEGPCV
jgi:plasmid stabilization system protein ParE